jgi:BirA family biotin operon repressor/biotin-[acetyl-CoA-carboxylase] ligase
MQLPLSASLASRLDFVTKTGSTNTDLVSSAARLAHEYPDFSVLVTDNQVAGRGRSGREWVAAPGSAMAVSVLLRPSTATSPGDLAWIPLMAGLAMRNTVNLLANSEVASIKWPNDVMVNDLKISGVLAELLPDLSAVVVGAGLNLLQTKAELPVETATSLAVECGDLPALKLPTADLFDLALSTYLSQLRNLYSAWVDAKANAIASGLQHGVLAACSTIGREVKALLPADQVIEGKAITIDNGGRLVIADSANPGQLTALAAADIVHLRPKPLA